MSCNDDQLKFSIFVINQIAKTKKKPTNIVFKTLSETGVLDDYVINCYDMLHTLGKEYLVEDITGMLLDRGVAI